MDTSAIPERRPPHGGPAARGDLPEPAAPERRLTPKGLATRARILDAAATLIHQQGAHLTNNENVRQAAGVSGSQLMRHFPTKESLVRGVIAWQAEAVVGALRELGAFDSVPALRRWARSYGDRDDLACGGCPFGALAAEVLKVYPEIRDEVAAGFARWGEVFRAGLQAMADRGELTQDADPVGLAHLLMAAFQGGMLLDQAAGDTRASRAALDGAVSYIATFATTAPTDAPAPVVPTAPPARPGGSRTGQNGLDSP
ncbi:TetR/AcrR family transcriptional regulator [Streptomyces sp. NBC_01198]|uniref:TetR/AcrR family transcriptional regulator n=1 Tax=Streptomyces sp. NBC_01198 TaxID=2903769 RepID=UPI002E15CA94|nr:TetR/AcrR family transcriptional regulator [Streptomyces sp. NBC_01198]